MNAQEPKNRESQPDLLEHKSRGFQPNDVFYRGRYRESEAGDRLEKGDRLSSKYLRAVCSGQKR